MLHRGKVAQGCEAGQDSDPHTCSKCHPSLWCWGSEHHAPRHPMFVDEEIEEEQAGSLDTLLATCESMSARLRAVVGQASSSG